MHTSKSMDYKFFLKNEESKRSTKISKKQPYLNQDIRNFETFQISSLNVFFKKIYKKFMYFEKGLLLCFP